ncbi:hypothetical protein FBUS_07006 [Fasciolopsis buskii]|uniref:TMEM62 Ig-like domain-containing protein n=1 Tax=Fasciolopsis buskii TaxID=27845 RepID=A0A8E0VKK7_9TREM|nr:hypothetical protein FBUS_07006 [Fasciolopsis buski]
MDYRFPRSDDKTHGSVWPVVLVTNPKDANFLMPEKEPVNRINQSDHIRNCCFVNGQSAFFIVICSRHIFGSSVSVLVWSNSTVVNVSLWIDDIYMGQAKQASSTLTSDGSSPLYILPWDPSKLLGSSTLRVEVIDSAGNRRSVVQPISLEGIPRRQFSHLSQWVLRSHFPANVSILSITGGILCIVFYMSWLFVFMGLVIPRCFGCSWLRELKQLLPLFYCFPLILSDIRSF